MCHRDSGISRHTIAGGNAGYDLKKGFPAIAAPVLLLPASKDKGVTALEPYHPFSLLCQLRQQLIGFTLLFVVISAVFPAKISSQSGRIRFSTDEHASAS